MEFSKNFLIDDNEYMYCRGKSDLIEFPFIQVTKTHYPYNLAINRTVTIEINNNDIPLSNLSDYGKKFPRILIFYHNPKKL